MTKSKWIPSEPLMTMSSILWTRKKNRISQLFDNQKIKLYLFYGFSRVALLEGLKLLAIEAGSNILLPAYICKVAVRPLYELGIEPRYYDVSDRLRVDTVQIKNAIDKKTRGVMIVNYFGFPAQELEEIQNLCEQFKLFLIEDNAHGFLSQRGSRLLGTFGDIGISSLHKALPTYHGGVLFINQKGYIQNQGVLEDLLARQNQYPATGNQIFYRYVAFSLLNYLEMRYGFPASLLRNTYHKLFSRLDDHEMSEFTPKIRINESLLQIAQGLNLEKTRLIRRQNYAFWLNEFSQKKGYGIIFKDLFDGVCPWVFPLIVEDAETFSKEMLDKGIPNKLWPLLPNEVLDNSKYPVANYLARHMIILPVHQSVDRNKLEKILKKD